MPALPRFSETTKKVFFFKFIKLKLSKVHWAAMSIEIKMQIFHIA